jgi:PKD repeat protein
MKKSLLPFLLTLSLHLIGQENPGTIVIQGDLVITGDLIIQGSIAGESQPTPEPTNESPVASFTLDTTSGDATLTVTATDTSTDSDGSVVGWLYNWGDGSTSTTQNPSHDYTVPGNYYVNQTVTDNDGATDSASPAQLVNVLTPAEPLPEYSITTLETVQNAVSLSWTDAETWSYPWLIQRSTTASFTDPTDLTDNQSTTTFRFLGVNATNYYDNEDLAEGTTYYYRVGVCTNLSDHYQNATTPTFQGWLYGEGTTTTLAAGLKLTYDVTDGAYGAISGDGLNDYPAILAALADAEAAGGGIIYIPAGDYDVWPPDDADVTVDGGGQLQLANGTSTTTTLFEINSDNITFLGDASGGVPTTNIDLYLWYKHAATEWLEQSWKTPVSGIYTYNWVQRYFVFMPYNAQNFTIKNLNVDMGATPVNSGKEWLSEANAQEQWDVSHKFFASFGGTRGFKNVVMDTVHVTNCRGEMVYNGGGSEKILVKNCDFRVSNSSTISGSFNLELVDSTLADSANGAVESAIGQVTVSIITGGTYYQNHIIRGCTILGLDRAGVMKDVTGAKNFAGTLIFNAPGTYWSVTDTTYQDCITPSYGPWYEARDVFRFNCEFTPNATGAAKQIFYTFTSAKASYNLSGGMSNVLWLGDTIHIEANMTNSHPIMYSVAGAAASGNESPWTWEAVHIDGTGQVNLFWQDTSGQANSRQNFIFKDFTKAGTITWHPVNPKIQHTSVGPDPTYINFFQ